MKRKSLFLITTILALAGFLATAWGTAQANQQSGVSLTARVGFDGYCKESMWIPVHITVENNGADVEATARAWYKNGSGGETASSMDVSLPSSSRKEFFLYLHSREYFRYITVAVMEGNRVLVKTSVSVACLGEDDMLVGLLADDPSVFDSLNDELMNGAARTIPLQISDLPDEAQGWDALDALVISNVDTGTLSAKQKQAMKNWAASGGKILVVGGIRWQAVVAGLQGLVPVEGTGVRNVTSLLELQTYFNDKSDMVGGAALSMGQPLDDAQVLIRQDGVPLFVRRRFGLGDVYYLAADPAMQPLRDWDGMGTFYANLFGNVPAKPVWANTEWDSYNARRALAALPELGLPPILYVCGWLAIYVMVISPINYFALRALKRRELAWLTIPLLAILFTALAYFTGFFYRGSKPILNRLGVAQGWEGIEQAKVNALVGVYSPTRSKYDIQSESSFMFRPAEVGDYPQGNDDWLSVQQDGANVLPDAQVEIGGMQSVSANGYMPALNFQHDLVLTFGPTSPWLEGSITNASGYALKDAYVFMAGDQINIGDFSPGDSREVRLSSTTTQGQNFFSDFNIYGDYSDLTYQRQRAVLGAIVSNSNNRNYNNGWGVYLVGWVENVPIPVGLKDVNFKSFDTFLYTALLTPKLKAASGSIMLPSSFFEWETSNSEYTPYYAYMGGAGESFTLRFTPSIPIRFSDVESLTLQVRSNSAPNLITASLWDFENKKWQEVELSYDSVVVPNAERYVGFNGEIRIKIEGGQNSWIEISQIGFRLSVKP